MNFSASRSTSWSSSWPSCLSTIWETSCLTSRSTMQSVISIYTIWRVKLWNDRSSGFWWFSDCLCGWVVVRKNEFLSSTQTLPYFAIMMLMMCGHEGPEWECIVNVSQCFHLLSFRMFSGCLGWRVVVRQNDLFIQSVNQLIKSFVKLFVNNMGNQLVNQSINHAIGDFHSHNLAGQSLKWP